MELALVFGERAWPIESIGERAWPIESIVRRTTLIFYGNDGVAPTAMAPLRTSRIPVALQQQLFAVAGAGLRTRSDSFRTITTHTLKKYIFGFTQQLYKCELIIGGIGAHFEKCTIIDSPRAAGWSNFLSLHFY
jgi:hypothetical protein